jgi:hypothetical protein
MVLVLIFSLVLSSCSFIGPLITTEEEKRAPAILMTEGQVWQKTAGTEDSRDRRAADSGSRESGATKI